MLRIISNATAKGSYSSAIEAGGFVFLAGQGGFDPATGELVGPGIGEQTERTLDNIAGLLAEAGLTLADLVQVTCYLVDSGDWAEMDRAYANAIGAARPTRTAVTVASLPFGVRVEISAIAFRSA